MTTYSVTTTNGHGVMCKAEIIQRNGGESVQLNLFIDGKLFSQNSVMVNKGYADEAKAAQVQALEAVKHIESGKLAPCKVCDCGEWDYVA